MAAGKTPRPRRSDRALTDKAPSTTAQEEARRVQDALQTSTAGLFAPLDLGETMGALDGGARSWPTEVEYTPVHHMMDNTLVLQVSDAAVPAGRGTRKGLALLGRTAQRYCT